MRQALVRLAIILGIAAAAPAIAQVAEGPQATQSASVVVSFNPSLNQPVRYRRWRHVSNSGRVTSTWSITEYAFTRREGGYRVQAREIDSGMPGVEPARAEIYRRLAAMLSVPFVLLLDTDGALVGIENEEELWRQAMRAIETVMAEQQRASSAADRAAMAQFMEAFGNMSNEARRALLLQESAPIVEFAAVEVRLGEEIETEVESNAPFGGSLRNHFFIRPERVENGHLVLTVESSVPTADLIASAERTISQIAVTGVGANTQEARAAALRELRNSGLSLAREGTYEVDLATGLTRRHRSLERVQTGIGEAATTVRETTVILERVQ